MMKQSLFDGSLKSYASQLNVVEQIKDGIPATFSLCIGAAIIWLAFGVLVGVISAVTAGQAVGPSDHRACPDRDLDAGLLARAARPLFLRARPSVRVLAGRRIRPIDRATLAVVRAT